MKNESITILIPSYNNANKLIRCLDSVVNQTYKNLKVILLDDNSLDNTEEIVGSYKEKLEILYVKNEFNLGRGGSRQKILNMSTTRLSCWLDSDDYIHNEKIEKQYKHFIENPNCTFLATPMYDTYSESEKSPGASNYEKIKSVNLHNLRITNNIPHPTVMFITDIAKKIGFNTNMKRDEDLDFYIRLYEKGYKVDVIPDILYYYCYY